VIPLDRTKKAVNPYSLALLTAPRFKVDNNPYAPFYTSSLHGLKGMSGIFEDIWDYGVDRGEDWLQNRLQSEGISGTDIIAMQNSVGSAMNQLANQYYALRNGNNATVALITQYQTAMQSLANSFCGYAQRMGTSRALAGCATIRQVAAAWNADRDKEKLALNQAGTATPGTTITDPVTGQQIIIGPGTSPVGGFSIQGILPILLGSIGVWALLKSSKRW